MHAALSISFPIFLHQYVGEEEVLSIGKPGERETGLRTRLLMLETPAYVGREGWWYFSVPSGNTNKLECGSENCPGDTQAKPLKPPEICFAGSLCFVINLVPSLPHSSGPPGAPCSSGPEVLYHYWYLCWPSSLLITLTAGILPKFCLIHEAFPQPDLRAVWNFCNIWQQAE